jgi:hypothetical protein
MRKLVIYRHSNDFSHKPLATSLSLILMCAVSVDGLMQVKWSMERLLAFIYCLREGTLGAGTVILFFC